GRRLTPTDLNGLGQLLSTLARRFRSNDYSLDEPLAIGLLQHYGLPTSLIDFTCHAGHGIAFAGTGDSKIGRICVLRTDSIPRLVSVVHLMEHPWCERPR